ncbi:MAG: hypothetical protein ACI3XW_01480, partial [Butyricicoccus sp.]
KETAMCYDFGFIHHFSVTPAAHFGKVFLFWILCYGSSFSCFPVKKDLCHTDRGLCRTAADSAPIPHSCVKLIGISEKE